MTAATAKRGLGRGLDALLGAVQESAVEVQQPTTVNADSQAQGVSSVAITQLRPSAFQPRKQMATEALSELAESIRVHGVIQPIVVRKAGQKYEIIAGERRWRASQKAGLSQVPIVIKDVDDNTVAAMALIENIQREDLNPMDAALGLNRLAEEFGLTHQQIATAVGKSRATITNLLRLMNLEAAVKALLESGQLEMGHARALLSLSGQEQAQAAQHVVKKALSVRETERYVNVLLARENVKKTPQAPKSLQLTEIQQQLSRKLSTKVNIQQNTKGKGKIVLHFNGEEDLRDLIFKLQ